MLVSGIDEPLSVHDLPEPLAMALLQPRRDTDDVLA
jgi:hypothetical protein